MADKEPTQRTDQRLEIPVPTRKAWDDTLAKVIKPANDGLQEDDDAAVQAPGYPADATGDG